ncbi:MAG TPA: xylulokinase [Ilumatobacteraceae bacterium]|nr:xylulokinase [Ilumatobacteraceae bacterium]
MPFVAGVDSSTQSTKVEIRDLATGDIVASASSPHTAVTPPRSEQDPQSWWVAFEHAWNNAVGELAGAGKNATVASVSIGGQQHGMVALDANDRPVHPAKLWNDTESAPDAGWLIGQLGGAGAWADAVGSVPVAAFTATKLSWLHRTHPDAWAQIARVLLPHDYLTHRLTGAYTTDRGDASGTGYWSPAAGEYRWDLLALIDADRDWTTVVPAVLGPLDTAGNWNGIAVAVGTGDNMAAALGLGLDLGDAVVSIGTSGTAFTVADRPTADPSGEVAGFADATGRFLPLVCTSNAAKVLDAVARLLGVDHDEFDRLALAARSDRQAVMLPYFDGERTPNRPDASGVLSGLRSDVSREEFARAAVDGVACGLLDAIDSLRRHADLDGRLVLTGGGARSRALQAVIAGLVGCPVVVADVDQAVATGAAVQAAALLQGCDHRTIQQQWGLGSGITVEHAVDSGNLRDRYGELRDATA